jgi:hypothetical protein
MVFVELREVAKKRLASVAGLGGWPLLWPVTKPSHQPYPAVFSALFNLIRRKMLMVSPVIIIRIPSHKVFIKGNS